MLQPPPFNHRFAGSSRRLTSYLCFRISPRMRLPLLGEISFSQLGKGAPSEHTTTHCTTDLYRTPHKEGKVTSTGQPSDQYWSQCEVVLVDISYQYWSLRRPVLVRIFPLLLVVATFRYSYIYDRRCLHHPPTTG